MVRGLEAAERLMLDGQVAGLWRSGLRRDSVLVEITPLRTLDADHMDALYAEAGRYAAFLGVKSVVELRDSGLAQR